MWLRLSIRERHVLSLGRANDSGTPQGVIPHQRPLLKKPCPDSYQVDRNCYVSSRSPMDAVHSPNNILGHGLTRLP